MVKFNSKTLVFLIIVGIVAFVLFNQNLIPLSVVGGFSTLSLSNVDIQTNDPTGNIQGDVWVLTVRQGGLGQHAVGTFSPEEISVGEKRAEKGFTLKLVNTEQKCNYPLIVDYGKTVYKYGYLKAALAPWENANEWAQERCGLLGQYLYWTKPSGLDYFCVYRNPIAGAVANLEENPNLEFKTTVSLEIEGESALTDTMSNTGNSIVHLGNKAVGIWQGNLSTGEQCPAPSSSGIKAVFGKESIYDWSTPTWRLVDSTKLSNYFVQQSVVERREDSLTEAELKNKIDLANSLADQSLLPKQFCLYNNCAIGKNSFSLVDGKYEINLNKQIQYPVMTFYIKADSLGIYQPTTKPVIVSTETTDFATGEKGSIIVKFKNDSEESGNFLIYADCSTAGFSQTGSNIERYVSAGQQSTVFVPISGSCSSRTQGNCTVVVKSLDFSGKTDSRNVSLYCSPQLTCTPEKRVCIDDVISQCNNIGTGWNVVEDCKSVGKVCAVDEVGTIYCKAKTNSPKPVCGNGKCEEGETINTCPADCGDCEWWQVKVEKDVPTYLIPLPFIGGLIQTGVTHESTCVTDPVMAMIGLMAIVLIGMMGYYFMKKRR